MSSDIYNVSNWNFLTRYRINDIVIYNSKFYYSMVEHISDASDFLTDLNAGKWGGNSTYNGEQMPFFIWKPSFGYNIESVPRVKSIKFGDGYSQDLADGINNIMLTFNLSFNERSLSEHKAIIHFLHSRAGYEKFFFVPPQPYGVIKKFVCKEWQPTQNFVDSYNLNARFEERV